MSLYDDDDTVTDKTAASGWASGIKMMQSQLAFKKATITAPKRDMLKKRTSDKLPPVIDLKSRREEEENTPPYFFGSQIPDGSRVPARNSVDTEWKFIDEYDPFWPNDYEKVVKEMRERRDREEDAKRRQEREEREKKRRERDDSMSGFSRPRDMEDDDDDRERPARRGNRGGGAAIAPPPSLDESTPIFPPMSQGSKSFGGVGGSIAAKIMAKYGFKEGQGLGKSQQGIVKALEVEKTSKRGGRIVTENDGTASPPPPPAPSYSAMPPPPMLPPSLNKGPQNPAEKPEPPISNILKKPSKVLILLNMVGPGEVDDELEPEVREECSSKYGNVIQVVIFEIPRAPPEEAVRIFVEFQRVEASIKAVIDLNGRFFGGRQVKAGFYDNENFKAFKLNESVEF